MEKKRPEEPLEIELSCSEETVTLHLQRQLLLVIRRQVVANVLDASSACILSLRMGLTDGVCYTLKDVSKRMHLSPEVVRQRQYLALKRCVRHLPFLQLLNEYAHIVKLPRGVTYYLYKFSDYDGELPRADTT
ncbi:MAG TPA: hypothetical protein VFV38_39430 [Ktedonobacteraceae bacterium]|nr:hypothetical protein [Ktedonobacteraceae bacterium]